MSKPNKLLANIETDIKIEKGLKIIEFATQYYLARSYLRSTPLNYNLSKKNTLKQQQEYAEIIAELNHQILQPKTTDLKISINKTNFSPSKIKEKQTEKSTLTKMLDSKSKEDIKTIFEKINSPESSIELPQNSKIPNKTQQKMVKTQSKVKKTKVEEIPILYANSDKTKVQEIPIPPASIHKKGKKVDFLEISKNNHSSSISQDASEDLKSQSINSSLDLNSEDFMSYHSESRSMKVIQEASESEQNSSVLQSLKSNSKKGKSFYPEGFSIQQFNSINYGKISIGNSTIIAKKIEPTKKGVQKSMQTSNILLSESIKRQPQKSQRQPQKTEKLSFLDRSITEIQQSDSKSFILGSELNNTEKSLLKQISESFVQNQKIKTLIKLQNLQLQQKHLLQRMEKRFQMCADEINQIRTIKWQSLNLPKGNIQIRRLNYAHCIE